MAKLVPIVMVKVKDNVPTAEVGVSDHILPEQP
jgi:hypothetical protein